MRGPDRLHCDATDPREGRGWGKPCPRKVVLDVWRELADPAHGYVMHYCERHAPRAAKAPACVIRQDVRRLSR